MSRMVQALYIEPWGCHKWAVVERKCPEPHRCCIASKRASREPTAYGKGQMLPKFLINANGLTSSFSSRDPWKKTAEPTTNIPNEKVYGLLALLQSASGADASVSQHHWM